MRWLCCSCRLSLATPTPTTPRLQCATPSLHLVCSDLRNYDMRDPRPSNPLAHPSIVAGPWLCGRRLDEFDDLPYQQTTTDFGKRVKYRPSAPVWSIKCRPDNGRVWVPA